MPNDRLATWQSRTDAPLIVAALLFLAAYAWPILDPQLSGWPDLACSAVNVVVWVAFAVDLGVRLTLTPDRGRYLLANWLDVVSLALPMFRPLRVLRAVLALNVLTRRGSAFARGRVVATVGVSVAVAGFVAALAVLDAERPSAGANIRSFSDALWWATSTIMTVGYGDRYPVTAEGRLVAGVLMLSGVALLGVVTAALASWFVERVAAVQAAEEHTSTDVARLAAEIASLREELRRREPSPSGRG